MTPTLDDQDRDIIVTRASRLRDDGKPDVGDYVEFADGVVRRVSHRWDNGVQTSNGGSFYLGDGYVSFSGGLEPIVEFSHLHATDEIRDGAIWIFHHDWASAHNAVHSEIAFKVYRCDLPTEDRYCWSCNAMVPGTHWTGADGRHKPPQPRDRPSLRIPSQVSHGTV